MTYASLQRPRPDVPRPSIRPPASARPTTRIRDTPEAIRGQGALVLGRTGDPSERAADRVAAAIAAESPRVAGIAGIHSDTASSGAPAPAELSCKIRQEQARGGLPLASAHRTAMEHAFATDFSRVRIHNHERAAELASVVHARAFTVGDDIFFSRGAPAPHHPHGRWLLAHELAHVVQDARSAGTTIRRAPKGVHGNAADLPMFKAGDILTREEFEATFKRTRRLAPHTIAIQIDGSGEHLVVPDSAVDRLPVNTDPQHIATPFKKNLAGQMWAAKLAAAGERQKTARAAARIGASDRMIGAFGVVGVVGGVALGTGLLSAALLKLGAGAPALLAGGYTLLDSDPANAPGPGDPTFAAKNPAQRAAEAALFALPAARLARGGATMREMMLWGGASSLGLQAMGDVGRGQRSSWNAYAGHGLAGALGWGLPMGPLKSLAGGARGGPLFTSFAGYGLAGGLGLRGARDLAAGQLSGAGDYARAGAFGLGAGLVGASTVTGLDFVARTAVVRSNQTISAGIPTNQSMTLEGLQQLFARRPDLAGRLGQRWLGMRSLAFPGNLVPRQGTANVGGGMETPQYTNVNPLLGYGGPPGSISNHVLARFEQIDQVFQPGTVSKLVSYRLPAQVVRWEQATRAAHRVMAPGGQLQINVWSETEAGTAQILEHLRAAGFRNVRLGGTFPTPRGPMEFPSAPTGPGVVISATR